MARRVWCTGENRIFKGESGGLRTQELNSNDMNKTLVTANDDDADARMRTWAHDSTGSVHFAMEMKSIGGNKRFVEQSNAIIRKNVTAAGDCNEPGAVGGGQQGHHARVQCG